MKNDSTNMICHRTAATDHKVMANINVLLFFVYCKLWMLNKQTQV